MNKPATKRLPLRPAGDQQRLANCIAGLRAGVAVSPSGHRMLTAPDPGALLACVLREIDETILPRRISIKAQSGLVAHLQVVARRLVHLDFDGEACPEGNATGTPEEMARRFTGRLLAFLSGSGEVTVRSSRITTDRIPAKQGSPARDMAQVASVDMDRVTGGTVTCGFFKAVGRLSVAWLNLDRTGRVTDCDGPEGQTTRLVELSRENFAELEYQLKQTSGAPGTPGCAMLDNNGVVDGLRLVYSRVRDARLLALVPPQAIARIQPTWQQYFGATRG